MVLRALFIMGIPAGKHLPRQKGGEEQTKNNQGEAVIAEKFIHQSILSFRPVRVHPEILP